MTSATDLATAVGAAVRVERTRLDLTQDDVAAMMRGFGWTWERSTVSKVEAGTRDVNLREILSLAVVLDTGVPVLLGSADAVRVADSLNLPHKTLAKVISATGPLDLLASEVDSPAADPVAVAARIAEGAESRQAVADHAAQVLGEEPAAMLVIDAAKNAHMEAERTAARRLGITAIQVGVIAFTLWNRSLTEEREARLAARVGEDDSANARRALRGHVTRELDDEMRAHLDAVGWTPDR